MQANLATKNYIAEFIRKNITYHDEKLKEINNKVTSSKTTYV